MARSNNNLKSVLQDTANAIKAKTGTSEPVVPRDFADAIENIPTGGGTVIVPGPNDNVIVYDYDGTVLDAKEVAVGQEYTLPSAPEHDGLTFDGWSCSTAPVNGKITIPATKQVRIGAMYYSNDNYSRFTLVVPKNITITILNSSLVDWGDGTPESSSNSHIYEKEGLYRVKALTSVGAMLNSYSVSPRSCLKEVNISKRYSELGNISGSTIEKESLYKTVTLNGNSFYACYALKFIVIPDGTTSLKSSLLENSHSLTGIVIPSSVTSIEGSAFQKCYCLAEIIMPDGVVSIGGSAFRDCSALTRVIFSRALTTISSRAFYIVSACGTFDFSNCQQVPTIQSDSIASIDTNAKIIVPDALYNDWIAASNWSNLASHIVKASEV